MVNPIGPRSDKRDSASGVRPPKGNVKSTAPLNVLAIVLTERSISFRPKPLFDELVDGKKPVIAKLPTKFEEFHPEFE